MKETLMQACVFAVSAAICTAPAMAAKVQDQPSSAVRDGDAMIDEVIVTAQRREERIQDVPISITAFSAERLAQQNITTAQSLNGVVPSLVVSNAGQASRETESYTLRGVSATFQGGVSVVTYMNEVPLPQGFSTSQQGGPGNFVDLENVQALAGPQGTLFGRNTTAGAVLLVPNKPTNNFEGYVQASVGNYNYNGYEGVLNVPIVDNTLLIRIVANYQDRDGYTRDVVWNKSRDNMHYSSGRIGITFRPNDTFENYLMAYSADSKNNGTSYIHQAFNIPLLSAYGICSDSAPPTSPSSCNVYRRQTELANQLGPRKTRLDVDEFDNTETGGVINTTKIKLSDSLTIRNIISQHYYKKDYLMDEDGTPLQQMEAGMRNLPNFPISGLSEFGIPQFGYLNSSTTGPRDNLKQFTEELQAQGKLLNDRLNYTVGGFYYEMEPKGPQLVRSGIFCPAAFTGLCPPVSQIYSVAQKSKALYAQGTLDLAVISPSLENFRLTAGIRKTWDEIRGSTTWYGVNQDGSVTCQTTYQTVANPSGCELKANLKSNAPTGVLGLDYKPTSNLMLFGKASRGYKAGAFNPFAVRLSTLTVDPEKLTSYELGFKSDSQIGNMPVRLNATYYHSDYSNIQQATVDGFGAQFVQGKAKIDGMEMEATIRPFKRLELGGNLSYTDGRFTESKVKISAPECVGVSASSHCTPFGAVKWIYSLNASLDMPVPEALARKLKLFASYSHISKRESFAGTVAPYGLVNLSASLRNVAQSNFDLELFVKNATNKLYMVDRSGLYDGVGLESVIYGEPRMYGLRLRYSFGS